MYGDGRIFSFLTSLAIRVEYLVDVSRRGKQTDEKAIPHVLCYAEFGVC